MRFLEIDATTIGEGIIGHGCNRQLAMGSGIAGALAHQWPKVRKQFMARNPVPALGSVDIVNITAETLLVANCYTQETYGPGDKKYADPNAIRIALRKLMTLGTIYNLNVYVPRIGCDLGGLDWKTEVKPVYEEIEYEFNHLTVGEPEFWIPDLVVIDVPGGKWGAE